MERIEEILNGVKTLGIGGHVRPDGDCVGSCMALYLYIRKYFPQIKADIYLESPKPVFIISVTLKILRQKQTGTDSMTFLLPVM